MSNLINLTFETSNPIRIIDQNGEFWFVANDVCNILEIQNSTQALQSLDNDEKAKLENTPMLNIGVHKGVREINIINESGLYALILRSRKAMEKGTVQHKFRKWVTSEVLPAIRKTGSYHTARPSNELTPKQHDALHRLVALCKMNFFRQDSASHAIWSRLRRVTGAKYPQKFTTEHLPILSHELQEIFLATEQYANAVRLAEQTFIRQVLKCNDKDIMAKLLSDISDAANTHHQQKQQLIPALFGKPLAELNS